MAVIKGQNLRILAGATVNDLACIAAATSCTIHMAANVEDSSTKDDEGNFQNNEVTGMSWDAQVEALVVVVGDDETEDANTLDALEIGETYVLRFAQTAGATGEQNRDAVNNALRLQGEAVLSDLQIVAQNRQNATYAAQFTGVGELEQYTPT